MSPKSIGEGVLHNKTWTVQVTSRYQSNLFAGYRLPDSLIEELVEQDADYIVFVDPNRGRYVSTLEDWLESGVNDGLTMWTHLRQSWMDRG